MLLFVIKEKKMLVHIVQLKLQRTVQGREHEAEGSRMAGKKWLKIKQFALLASQDSMTVMVRTGRDR